MHGLHDQLSVTKNSLVMQKNLYSNMKMPDSGI